MMIRTIHAVRALRFMLAGALLASFASASVAQDEVPTQARVIVRLKPDSTLARAQALSVASGLANRAEALGRRAGVPIRAGHAVSEHEQVVHAEGLTSQALAERLAQDADVLYAVPDERRRRLVAPSDPLYARGPAGTGPDAGQWYLRPPTSELRASIDAEAAWSVTTGSAAIVVAVLDTGLRFDHPDLVPLARGGNVLAGYDMIADVATANDADGRDADASDPGDFVTQSEITQRNGPFFQCAPQPEPSSWHGTQVAALIGAATDNGIGMASVGRNVRLLPVRVLGKCGGFDSDIIAAIRWAAGLAVPGVPANANRARVINLSLGSEGSCTAAYLQAISDAAAAGAVVVAAAGNSAGHAVMTPANCSGAIAVGGLRHAGTKVGFSDLGATIAISAPAGNCVNTGAGTPCLYPILTASDAGTATPAGPIYTDSFNASVGTSFAAPLASGTAALMLSAQPALAAPQLREIMQATARRFAIDGGDNGDGSAVPVCTAPQFDAIGNPVNQLQCYCTTATCGAGMLDAGAAVRAAASGLPVAAADIEGLWWNGPAGSESGWGLNVAQQGDVIFVTWFTYDGAGNPWWLSMTGTRLGARTYAGTLYETQGPPFSAVPFDPARVTFRSVGEGTLDFADADRGTWRYTVEGTTQVKAIVRQVFGPVPTCTFAALADPAAAANYQDLWWASPAGSESGWGINLVQQGSIIFATWFTYGSDGKPLWLSMTATASGSAAFAGTLYRTTGPAYSASPWNPASVVATPVGSASLTFGSGNAGSFAYDLLGVAQSRPITRQVFRSPGTVCR